MDEVRLGKVGICPSSHTHDIPNAKLSENSKMIWFTIKYWWALWNFINVSNDHLEKISDCKAVDQKQVHRISQI